MDENNQLYLMLGRIDGKLDHALQRQEKSDLQIETLSKRVSVLEKNKAWVVGAATALSTLVSICFSFLKGAIFP